MLFSFIFLKPSSIAAIPALSSEPSTVVPSLFIIPLTSSIIGFTPIDGLTVSIWELNNIFLPLLFPFNVAITFPVSPPVFSPALSIITSQPISSSFLTKTWATFPSLEDGLSICTNSKNSSISLCLFTILSPPKYIFIYILDFSEQYVNFFTNKLLLDLF